MLWKRNKIIQLKPKYKSTQSIYSANINIEINFRHLKKKVIEDTCKLI